MTELTIISMPDSTAIAANLARVLGGPVVIPEMRNFPDGETYIRIPAEVANQECIIVSSVDEPDRKFLPLAFAADALRDLGARRVGLVAPYLAYMRQDKRFKPGEAITSRTYSRLMSDLYDWIATVDPHLHRYRSLQDIYSIPTSVVHAAPELAVWVRENVVKPLIVGPDSESEQWVRNVAEIVDCPYIVLEKNRFGDRDVRVSVPDVSAYRDRVPVILDDIVSSARTMIEACGQFSAVGLSRPICVAVHGLFADDSYNALKRVAGDVVTTNAVEHESNRIDLSRLIADGVRGLLAS